VTFQPQHIIIKIISKVDCLTTNEKKVPIPQPLPSFLVIHFVPLSDSASEMFSPYLLQAVISSTGLNGCCIVKGDKT